MKSGGASVVLGGTASVTTDSEGYFVTVIDPTTCTPLRYVPGHLHLKMRRYLIRQTFGPRSGTDPAAEAE